MTSSFANWLFDQVDREDEVGDLAREFEDDEGFPDDGDRAVYEAYFDEFDVDTQAVFERAWEEFELGDAEDLGYAGLDEDDSVE